MLADKQPLHDVDTQSDKSEDESEDVDTNCNSCNKDLHISHSGTCPVCAWTDIIPIVQGITAWSVIFDCPKEISLMESPVAHVDEIMDVSTDRIHFLEHKIDE
jgi:hypothetical protein